MKYQNVLLAVIFILVLLILSAYSVLLTGNEPNHDFEREKLQNEYIMQCQEITAEHLGDDGWSFKQCLENMGVLEKVRENNAKYKDTSPTSNKLL